MTPLELDDLCRLVQLNNGSVWKVDFGPGSTRAAFLGVDEPQQ